MPFCRFIPALPERNPMESIYRLFLPGVTVSHFKIPQEDNSII
jgi:hypothetical protein